MLGVGKGVIDRAGTVRVRVVDDGRVGRGISHHHRNHGEDRDEDDEGTFHREG